MASKSQESILRAPVAHRLHPTTNSSNLNAMAPPPHSVMSSVTSSGPPSAYSDFGWDEKQGGPRTHRL